MEEAREYAGTEYVGEEKAPLMQKLLQMFENKNKNKSLEKICKEKQGLPDTILNLQKELEDILKLK